MFILFQLIIINCGSLSLADGLVHLSQKQRARTVLLIQVPSRKLSCCFQVHEGFWWKRRYIPLTLKYLYRPKHVSVKLFVIPLVILEEGYGRNSGICKHVFSFNKSVTLNTTNAISIYLEWSLFNEASFM